MTLHRNSQKRFYLDDHAYFVTGVTQSRIRYFEEEVFCEVFLENLKLCQELKGFELHGWFLGYDHFHLLITPKGKWNISEIMKSIKGNSSCDINRIMMPEIFEGEVPEPRLQISRLKEIYGNGRKKFFDLKTQFHQKYPKPHLIPFSKFKWQRSFHDHVIRDERDFEGHIKYIEYNPIKHKMPEGWKWWGLNLDK